MADDQNRRLSYALPEFDHEEELSSDALPEGWIVINEVNEDGVVEYFINVITNQTFYSRKDLMRYVAYARWANLPALCGFTHNTWHVYLLFCHPFHLKYSVGQSRVRCSRCRNTGHHAPQCGFSESYVRAISALYQPPPFRRGQSNQRTVYQCSRCGRYGHNARTCHGPLVA